MVSRKGENDSRRKNLWFLFFRFGFVLETFLRENKNAPFGVWKIIETPMQSARLDGTFKKNAWSTKLAWAGPLNGTDALKNESASHSHVSHAP